MTLKLHIGNTIYVILDGLRDSVSGAYINSATVTVTVLQDGTPVSGESWPVTMTYVGGSNGKYVGTLSSGLSLDTTGIYNLNVHTVSGTLVADHNFRSVGVVRDT